MSNDIKLADQLIDVFLRGDAATIDRICTDDVEFINVPLPKAALRGKQAMMQRATAANSGFPEPVTNTGHRVLRTIDNGQGDVVIERFDYWTLRGVDMGMQAVGIFRIENGKVKSWTDHYDVGTYIRQVEAVGIKIDTSAWW
jgi:limonene-1,2-epoxide hydrolase